MNIKLLENQINTIHKELHQQAVPADKIVKRLSFSHLNELIKNINSLKIFIKENFIFSDIFLRVIFPVADNIADETEAQVKAQVEAQVEIQILDLLKNEKLSSKRIANRPGHKTISGNIKRSLPKLLSEGLIEYTIPDKPKSRNQQYSITAEGIKVLESSIK